MKRDLSILRGILLQIEASNSDPLDWVDVSIAGVNDVVVNYHIKLAYEAGLIHAVDASSNDGSSWHPTSLTWNGHEALDAMRDENVFKETQRRIGKLAGWTLPIAVELGKEVLKEHLGLSGNSN